MSFRRDVIMAHPFNERLSYYGLGEDKDASFGALADQILVGFSKALIYHHEFPGARHDGFRRGVMEILNQAYITCRHCAPGAKARRVTTALLTKLPDIRRVVQTDVQAAYTGDPAARSVEEIILAYPCVLAISLQRIAHVLHELGVPLLPRMLTEYGHERTGVDLHPGAKLGTHFFIDHCVGVVIGETATIGNHVKLYQGVTLGAKSFEVDGAGNPVKGVKRHPDIGDHVTIYAHATILGGTTRIGDHSVIGGNVWLLESLAPHSIAYYKGDDLVIRPRLAQEPAFGGDWTI